MKIFAPEKFLILVIDDVNKNLQLLSNILESVGYGTTFATSGQNALERLKNIKPDLILLDLMMPEMDGLQVCEVLKANPAYQEIPVIFITASHEQENLLQAFERGAVDYVTKPFNPPELLARVRTHLELKDTKDQLNNTLEQLVKARDAALESARIKSQFLANMSHEIRTPMNAVLGMTEILLNTPLNEHQLDCLKTLKSSGENLLMIINDILDFSKLEAGAVRLETEGFALHSVVKELIDFLTPQAEAKGIKLNYYIDSNVPQALIGDANRLRQILTNLIGNAIKFTEVGEVIVKLTNKLIIRNDKSKETSSVLGENNYKLPIELLFSIGDTGIGISQEDRKKLFKSFSQADSSNIRKYGGTGLGLVICKQLVQLMGGEIGCHSILGKGSTFWFTAVFEQAELEKIMPSYRTNRQLIKLKQEEQVTNFQHIFKEIKLLIVEDSQINQKVILNQLHLLGYQADCVSNGQEALEIIAERNYDIILMDCQMPILDGYETTEKLRQKEKKQRNTIVIGLTAYAMPSDRQKCLDAGMNDYLSKPATMNDLAVMLEKWSTEHQQQVTNYPVREKLALFPTSPSNHEFSISQSHPPIDLERLHNITGGDVEMEAQLLEIFVENIEIYLVEIKAVLEAKDAIALKHKAHAIKGAAANFGVHKMTELAKQIENKALENNLVGVAELIAGLEQILIDVSTFMQENKRSGQNKVE